MKLLKKFLVVLIVCLTLTETIGASFSVIDAKAVSEETIGGGSSTNENATNPFVIADWKDTGKKTYVADGTFNGEQGYYLVEQVRKVGYYTTVGWIRGGIWQNADTISTNSVNTSLYTGNTLKETVIWDTRTLYKYLKQTITKKTYSETIYHTQFRRNKGTLLRPKWEYYEYKSNNGYITSWGSNNVWKLYKKWKTTSYYTKDIYSYEKTDYLASQPGNVGTTITYSRTNDKGLKQVKIATRTFYYKEKYEYRNVERSAYQTLHLDILPVLHVRYTQADSNVSSRDSLVSVDTYFIKKGDIYNSFIENIQGQLKTDILDTCKNFTNSLSDIVEKMATEPEEFNNIVYYTFCICFDDPFDDTIARKISNIIKFEQGRLFIGELELNTESLSKMTFILNEFVSVAKVINSLATLGVGEDGSRIIAEAIFDFAWRHFESKIDFVGWDQLSFIMTVMDKVAKCCYNSCLKSILEFDESVDDDEIVKIDFYTYYKYLNNGVFTHSIYIDINLYDDYKYNVATIGQVMDADKYISSSTYMENASEIIEQMNTYKMWCDVFSVNDFLTDLYVYFSKQ